MTRRRRAGLTLFEVVISLAIFLAAVVALWNLCNAAGNRASQTQLATQASVMCQSKLAEALVGIQPMGSIDWSPIPDVDNFYWRMDAEQQDTPGLYLVHVSVKQEANGVKSAETTLTQFALAPANRGSTLDLALQQSNAAANSMDPSNSGNNAASGSGASNSGASNQGSNTNAGGKTPSGGSGKTTTGGSSSGGSTGRSSTGSDSGGSSAKGGTTGGKS